METDAGRLGPSLGSGSGHLQAFCPQPVCDFFLRTTPSQLSSTESTHFLEHGSWNSLSYSSLGDRGWPDKDERWTKSGTKAYKSSIQEILNISAIAKNSTDTIKAKKFKAKEN